MVMDLAARVDPELVAALEAIPTGGTLDWDDLPATRAARHEVLLQTMAGVPDLPQITKEDRVIPGAVGDPDVPVRIYRPAAGPGHLPALLWIHGGGYVLGSVAMNDFAIQDLVREVGCVTASVEYRLAPEHPFPAPLDDCYAALRWLHGNAATLGVDPTRIAIGGASAGGGLAAGLALLARDRGEVPVVFQLLIYPMIDDRNLTPSSHALTDPRVWNRASNHRGWRAYLGQEPGGDGVSPYAAAARAADLTGLPPAYIPVGTCDLFLDENIAYAQRLLQSGVPVELHLHPGAFHGSENLAPSAALSQRMLAERYHALRRALQLPGN
jgi:acetyl esterase/lipase